MQTSWTLVERPKLQRPFGRCWSRFEGGGGYVWEEWGGGTFSSISGSNLMDLHLCLHRCVHIGLEASEETDVTLLVSYVVSNASWSPAYDVRVLPVTKEMKVGIDTLYV